MSDFAEPVFYRRIEKCFYTEKKNIVTRIHFKSDNGIRLIEFIKVTINTTHFG
jgi:hypothetical protein